MIERGIFVLPWSHDRSDRVRASWDSANSSTTVPATDPLGSRGSSPPGNRPRSPSNASEGSPTGTSPLRLLGEGSPHHRNTSPTPANNKKERVCAEDERLYKARKMIDLHLKKIAMMDNKALSLNRETGMGYFPYQKFIVVMEVPSDHPDTLFLYTCVCRCEVVLPQVLQTAMELNYMQLRTRGATLGLEKSEINLCLSSSLVGLTPAGLKKHMDDFLHTASEVHVILERSKTKALR